MTSCSTDKLFKFNNNKIAQNLSKKLNEQRKLKKFSDYAVKTEDGGYIPVHKLVLISGNSFYEKLFECGFEDSMKEFHLMKGVSTEHAEKLVNYIYTGDIEMSLKDALKILDNAVFFDMPDLVKFCCEVLIKSINNENCFKIWRCLRSNGALIEDIFRIKCAKYIFEKKKNVLDQLKTLTVDELEDLLSDGNQNDLDETCFSVAIEWFLSNFNEREKYVGRLLNKIHLKNISYKFFVKNILGNEILKNNINFLQLTFEFFKLNESELIPVNKKETVNIKSATPTDVLLIITDDEILRYSLEERKILTTDYLKIPNGPIKYAAITTFGNDEDNIFICGGMKNKTVLANCNYFSIKENKWNNLPPMMESRFYHRVVNFDKKIYACGGQYHLATVEYFDLNLSKWFEAPSMNNAKFLFGLTTLKNCLYAIQNTGDIEYFDPRENKWIKYEICNSKWTKTFYIRHALNFDDNIIYCIGKDSIHKLDVRNKKWINKTLITNSEYDKIASACFYKNYLLCLHEKYRDGKYDLCVRTFDKSSLQEINCGSIPFESEYEPNGILCINS